ncbi:MlaD family protein [Crocinitomix catalasitica]|uniref:MlaD family protein n=1 Tax=Crocinitomix catalasitica TaxID=184607 RepID=UPI00048A3C43|nr:MlaD family protein [Crocinitomix catalasitica]
MKVSKEFKVGLLVILGIFLLLLGVNFLKGSSLFGKNRVFHTVFTNSSGLQVSNEVQLNGLKIGQVSSVGLHPENPNIILVSYTLNDNELQITNSSVIELISSDILGTKALDLKLDITPRNEFAYFENGDTIPGTIAKSLETQISEELLPLKKKTEELIKSVESIIVSVNAFWDTSAAYTIDEGLDEARYAIAKFGDLANNLSYLIKKETDRVDVILSSVGGITENLSNKSEQISGIINNLEAITASVADADLKPLVGNLSTTLVELNELLTSVNQGEGTIGALLHTDSLHNELVNTNLAIQSLLEDMQRNPNKYVHFSLLGRKVKGVQLSQPEEDKLREILK